MAGERTPLNISFTSSSRLATSNTIDVTESETDYVEIDSDDTRRLYIILVCWAYTIATYQVSNNSLEAKVVSSCSCTSFLLLYLTTSVYSCRCICKKNLAFGIIFVQWQNEYDEIYILHVYCSTLVW